MNITKKNKLKYYKFLNSLPIKMNRFYFNKLQGNFKLKNKSKKRKGFDPVTNIDKAFELFIRKEILKKFPNDKNTSNGKRSNCSECDVIRNEAYRESIKVK